MNIFSDKSTRYTYCFMIIFQRVKLHTVLTLHTFEKERILKKHYGVIHFRRFDKYTHMSNSTSTTQSHLSTVWSCVHNIWWTKYFIWNKKSFFYIFIWIKCFDNIHITIKIWIEYSNKERLCEIFYELVFAIDNIFNRSMYLYSFAMPHKVCVCACVCMYDCTSLHWIIWQMHTCFKFERPYVIANKKLNYLCNIIYFHLNK